LGTQRPQGLGCHPGPQPQRTCSTGVAAAGAPEIGMALACDTPANPAPARATATTSDLKFEVIKFLLVGGFLVCPPWNASRLGFAAERVLNQKGQNRVGFAALLRLR
jgi:hypothetical protein